MKQIVLSLIFVQHTASLRLHRNAALALNVELVQELLLPSRLDGARELEQPVAEGALAMVDMGDNAEVSEAVQWYLRYPLLQATDAP